MLNITANNLWKATEKLNFSWVENVYNSGFTHRLMTQTQSYASFIHQFCQLLIDRVFLKITVVAHWFSTISTHTIITIYLNKVIKPIDAIHSLSNTEKYFVKNERNQK